jgi:formimidoylglutamate deiminase
VVLKGPVIPGIPNLHSHAHQRAMAGLAERASQNGDSFWTWRETMYHYVNRINPDQLEAIARQLYVEMLKAGYTSVAEFQYLHHDPSGAHYENPAHMTLQCLHAACETGIGFTALPVLYQHGGFGSKPAGDGQRRFINDVATFLEIVERLFEAAGSNPNLAVGVAPHSLRAVNTESLVALLDACGGRVAAVHIHIAEQRREVEECLAWSGQRPVEWLLNHVDVDAHWCLVHATHMKPEETRALAVSGAVAGLCPTTEASLGDGLFDARGYLAAHGCWGIGSDSQISVSPVEELRWLEYGIRLNDGIRNALATTATPNTGQAILEAALKGGARACGRPTGAIARGRRADFVVLDGEHPRLYTRRHASLVDSWIFSGNDNLVRDVFVGGTQVIADGRHRLEEGIARDYRRALDQLNP